jgi:hypothetical protein
LINTNVPIKHTSSRSIIYSSPRPKGRGHNRISVCNWFRVFVWFRSWFNSCQENGKWSAPSDPCQSKSNTYSQTCPYGHLYGYSRNASCPINYIYTYLFIATLFCNCCKIKKNNLLLHQSYFSCGIFLVLS